MIWNKTKQQVLVHVNKSPKACLARYGHSVEKSLAPKSEYNVTTKTSLKNCLVHTFPMEQIIWNGVCLFLL